jgi:hypothetical protein
MRTDDFDIQVPPQAEPIGEEMYLIIIKIKRAGLYSGSIP